MNVSDEELSRWVASLSEVNSHLAQALSLLERGVTREAIAAAVEAGRRKAFAVSRAIERAGAEPYVPEVVRQLIPDPTPVPLALLDSPANRRYAALLRETWEALKAVEAERGIDDGASEVLEDWLVEVNEEIHGPVGLGEGG